MKKSRFLVWWLIIELLVELLKACLPKQNKTKTNKKNHKCAPTPPGISPPLASHFSRLGSGALSRNLVTLSVNGNSERSAVGSGNRDRQL